MRSDNLQLPHITSNFHTVAMVIMVGMVIKVTMVLVVMIIMVVMLVMVVVVNMVVMVVRTGLADRPTQLFYIWIYIC